MALTAALLPSASPSRTDHVAALLRERQLDRTLTEALPERLGADRLAAFGLPVLDERLGGGLPRGQMCELVGTVSSGRTSLAWTWLAAATRRGEAVALIDTFDRFDPATAVGCGMELSRVLWVRGQAVTRTAAAVDPAWQPGTRAVDGPGTLLERTVDRALKAFNLVLQSGVCTAVVLDLVDVPLTGLRRIPHTTWLRLQRVIEGSDTACLVMGALPLARSAGGLTITTGAMGVTGITAGSSPLYAQRAPTRSSASGATGIPGDTSHEGTKARGQEGCLVTPPSPSLSTRAQRSDSSVGGTALWRGTHDRSRRLAGVQVMARLSSPRRTVQGVVALHTTTRCDGP